MYVRNGRAEQGFPLLRPPSGWSGSAWLCMAPRLSLSFPLGPKAMLSFYCSTLSSPLLLLLLSWFCIDLVAWLLVIVFRRRFEFACVYHAPSHLFFSSAVLILVAACTTCGACGICRICRIDGICRTSRIRTTRRLGRHDRNWSDCSYSHPCLAHLQP